jgi:hypothetical protein
MVPRDNYYNEEDKNDARNFEKLNPQKIALKIAWYYFIIGLLWIVLSDKIIINLIRDTNNLVLISIYNSFYYILFSIYLL